MPKKLVLVIAAIALIASTGIALAAGTPTWWDNPGGASSWRQYSTTGTAANSGDETQLITIIFDVPNECPPSAASKEIWEQIEWTVNSGTASLSNSVRTIAWGTDSCPSSTSDPYADLDSGNMTERGSFTPDHGYANGAERSRTIGSDSDGWSPKCERIFTSFQVDEASSLSYRLEVQSICKGPNAVTLSGLQASQTSRVDRFVAMLRGWLTK